MASSTIVFTKHVYQLRVAWDFFKHYKAILLTHYILISGWDTGRTQYL